MRDSRFVKLICAAAACACICTSSAMAKNEEKNLYTMNLMQTGESDGNDYVTRAEFAAILVRGFEVATANQNSSFEDMEGHWAKEYAAAVYDAGISKGIGDGKALSCYALCQCQMEGGNRLSKHHLCLQQRW